MSMSQEGSLKRHITTPGGIAILSGIMVGSGIFFIGSYVLYFTGFSIGLALLVWAIGGLLTLSTSLVYAELGTSLPKTGGYYVYLREAYGKRLAFLSGFTNFLLSSSGSIAALGIAFSLILSNVFAQAFGAAIDPTVQKIIAAALIVVLSVLNYFGVKIGTMVQKVLLVVKAIPILIVLAAGLLLGTQSVDWSISLNGASLWNVLAMLGFGVVATFWAYEGWTNLNNMTEEVKDPGKTLPKALIGTVLGVAALYILYNASIYRVIPIAEIRTMIEGGDIYLGITAAASLLGQAGMFLVVVTMLISVFGALSGCIMAFPRVYYAMGKDGSFFSVFAKVDAKTGTPWVAIVASGLASIVLLLFNLTDLVTLVAFAGVAFNILIVVSLFLFRKKYPDLERPYKTFGYPFVPALTVVLLVGILIATIAQNPTPSLIGLGVVVAGLPIYEIITRLEIHKAKNDQIG
jgi:basic amino acid/polyamine antiporter, APA family